MFGLGLVELVRRTGFPRLMPLVQSGRERAFQDSDYPTAITCTDVEALILAAITSLQQTERAIEIGSYVGWSSAFLALGGCQHLTCVDNYTENHGRLVQPNLGVSQRFLDNIERLGLSGQVQLAMGDSPQILPELAPAEGWDLAFIDGWHYQDQPLQDVQGVEPFLKRDGLILLHDLWIANVQAAGDYLKDQGWQEVPFQTHWRMALFHRPPGPSWLAVLADWAARLKRDK